MNEWDILKHNLEAKTNFEEFHHVVSDAMKQRMRNNEESIIKYLSENGPNRLFRIYSALGMKRESCKKALDRLEKKAEIKVVYEGERVFYKANRPLDS